MTQDDKRDGPRDFTGDDPQLLLILAYTRLFLLPEREDGSKATWIAMLGDCELRLLEILVPDGTDVCPLWVELYDRVTCRAVDSIGCRHLYEAGSATELLVAGAKQRRSRSALPLVESSSTGMETITGTVRVRFPDSSHAIEELALSNDEFRSLCADFTDVEVAIKHWEHADSALREERCAEYRELREDLAREIRAFLDCFRSE